MNKKVVIFDIDGTLADIEHRRGYVRSKPKNWPAFEAGIPNDGRMERTIDTLNDMVKSGDWYIILASGRGEESRLETVKWLKKNLIHYDELLMRPEKDYRRDDIIKQEILDDIRSRGMEPVIVFDDRQQVVDMWRRNGLIVHQVAEGNF